MSRSIELTFGRVLTTTLLASLFAASTVEEVRADVPEGGIGVPPAGPVANPNLRRHRAPLQLTAAYAVFAPLGEVDQGESVSSVFGIQHGVELELELGTFPSGGDGLSVGAYLDLTTGGAGSLMDSLCASAAAENGIRVDCSSAMRRAGLQVKRSWATGSSSSLWVGMGLGYEFSAALFRASDGSSSGSSKATFHGIELRPSVGADLFAWDLVGIGAFATASWGYYVAAEAGGKSYGVTNPSMHFWLGAGLRATLHP